VFYGFSALVWLRGSLTFIYLIYRTKLVTFMFFTVLVCKPKFIFKANFLTLQNVFQSQYIIRSLYVTYEVKNPESSLPRQKNLSDRWLSAYLILNSFFTGNHTEVNLTAPKQKLFL